MAELRLIPGVDAWTRVSIQALNRFYTRGDAKVVANWMTRQDRDLAIADNIAYVNAALDEVLRTEHSAPSTEHLVFIGFSQGVAMAYRAALMAPGPGAGVLARAGYMPPVLAGGARARQPWPKVLIGVGDKEEWYSRDRVEQDEAFLASRGVPHAIERFEGGHEWTDAFRAAAGEFLTTGIR